ncbi:MAG: chemotaxis-specific protein-glutamate methyltransferase CheB [Syntrophorhabdales bacterium]|jgi:two-component system chemotaxis response regulator CheB
MIEVLVVDDSPVACALLSHVLSSDPGIRVIDAAGSGRDAIESIKRHRPDIVTMDINMSYMNGFEATRIIMETDPLPIVIVTDRPDIHELEMSFQAIEAGALAVLQKPHGPGHPAYATNVKDLITAVKLMSEIKVVKRRKSIAEKKGAPRINAVDTLLSRPAEVKVIAIGASTGGPPVIETILSGLSKDFPLPVVIVQHMAPGFTEGLAEWLRRKSSLSVHVAERSGVIRPGHVYLAPDGFQMKVDANGRLLCTDDGPENGLRPSVSYLFRSVSKVFGKASVGVLLTGMGKDGAEELKVMKEKGALTIAQDEESSVVFGMPGEAIRINAATYALPPDRIVSMLNGLGMSKRKQA